MLFFLYFFIGHFAADFFLQTNSLVKWKQQSIWGVILHTIAVWIVTLIVLLPYLSNKSVLLAITINAVTHFYIDHLKIKYESRYLPKNHMISFILDQVVHLSIILGLVLFLNTQSIEPQFFINSWWYSF